MTDYNATVTLAHPYVGARAERLADLVHGQLAAYSPATGAGPDGSAQVTITLPATNTAQAIETATRILIRGNTLGPVVALEVMTTEAFDRRNGITPLPELVTVSGAAELLGVSRQAVLQRIESGRLPARKVDKVWVIARADVR